MSSSQNQNFVNEETVPELKQKLNESQIMQDTETVSNHKNCPHGEIKSEFEHGSVTQSVEENKDKSIHEKTPDEENIEKNCISPDFSVIDQNLSITHNQTNEVSSNKIIKQECKFAETTVSTQLSKIQLCKTEDSVSTVLQQPNNSSPVSTLMIENAPIEEKKKDIEIQQQQQEIAMITLSNPTSTNEIPTVETIQQPNKSIETTTDKSDLSSSLWIRNITTATKAADIKALFSKHAKVITAKIFTTKNKQSPTCFGYVSLAHQESADLCVQKLNRLNFKGRIINVEKADRSNLSQINKNVGSNAETKQQKTNKTKTSRTAKEIMLSKQEKSESDQSGRSTRPRITASGESSSKDSTSRKPITSYDTRKRYSSSNSRLRVASEYSRVPARKTQIYQYPVRRGVQTSRGIRVSTTSAYPYNSRITRDSFTTARADINQHQITSRFTSNRDSYRSQNSDNDAAKEEIIKLMRRREEEHRKKEEGLRLEREREKLRYEREKLEREKLELETLKLQAQLAQAAQLQIAGLSSNAGISASATQFIPQQQQYHHATRKIGRRENNEPNKERKNVPSHSSLKEDRSTSRQHMRHDSRSRATRDHRESRVGEEQSHRSRSPLQRVAAVIEPIYRGRETIGQTKPNRQREDNVQHGDTRRDTRHLPSSYAKSNATMKSSTGHYGKRYSGTRSDRNDESGHHDRTSSNRRISSPTTNRREYFGSGGQGSGGYNAANSITNSYAARTDPSYALRIGHTIGDRQVDEMFGSNAFGMNARGSAATNYTRQEHYGREPSSNSYFQNTNWSNASGSGRNDVPSSSRTYNLWNTASQNWNAYEANNLQTTSTSSGRFPASSYSKQVDGSSYTSGRRY